MKSSTKRFAAFLVDLKSMMFGLAIFTFIWACLRSPEFFFPSNLFLAVLLLAASVLIRLNKLWSNLIAAIISGYLPLEFLRAFLMFPKLAEVPMLSSEHFRYFFGTLQIEHFLIFFAVTLMMLIRSVFAVIHNHQSIMDAHVSADTNQARRRRVV